MSLFAGGKVGHVVGEETQHLWGWAELGLPQSFHHGGKTVPSLKCQGNLEVWPHSWGVRKAARGTRGLGGIALGQLGRRPAHAWP